MKRVEEFQVAREYRRLLLTALPLGISGFTLIGYRWYTFANVHRSVFSDIFTELSNVSNWAQWRYWFEALRFIRESLPMVEVTLLVINVAIVGILLSRFRGMWRTPIYPRQALEISRQA
ncbi:MAG: hypothetical protein Q8R13_04795 [bacterium]|nr:hypothetical protein [bacterium]